MASMNPPVRVGMPITINSRVQSVVQFSVNWKIRWPEFASISSSFNIGKIFITSNNNIPLRWKAVLQAGDYDRVGFFMNYQEGPIENFRDMQWTISIMKSDLSIAMDNTVMTYETSLRLGHGWRNLFDKDPVTFRARFGLQESNPLVIRITLMIPKTAFSYVPSALPPATPPQWLIDQFADIQNPDKFIFSIAKLISRDGIEFKCDKMIAYQCPALQATFRRPPPNGRPENEYEFPRLGTASLKILIQYLYTGQADLANKTTTILIELTEAAKTYGLNPLKDGCTAVLWKMVVENPESCIEILRFAHLHYDLKDLKNRAMDVLAENYQTAYSFNMFGDGMRGQDLREHFHLFLTRRVEANSAG